MSIISGYKKFKKHIKTNEGFQLQSLWTNANTVEADDKRTMQTKVGAINGISSSETANSGEIAASTALTNKMNGSINQLSRDLDVGSDSGMTIGSMVKAIYDKVINSAAISGHLRGGRSRGGSGTGEVTFNNIKKGSTITISSVVIPPGAGEAIKTTVDGDIVITGAGSYTLTKDGTVKIVAHVYLGDEGTSGYAECDFKIV